MNGKELTFGANARNEIMSGIDKVVRSVGGTIGPAGQLVVIDSPYGARISKDGVSVANAIQLTSEKENVGVKLLRQACQRTVESCGDGTSSTTLLAGGILEYGNKAITAGSSPVKLKRGIEMMVDAVVDELERVSIPVDSDEMIKQVGLISSNGDENVANLIGQAIKEVGTDGVIMVNKSKSSNTTVDVVQGMALEGATTQSPYFFNRPESLSTVLEDCYVLLIQEKVTNLMDLVGVMQQVAQSGKPLLIMSEGVEGEALSVLVNNVLRGTVSAIAVNSPFYGAMRHDTMADIAVMTNGTYFTNDLGIKLSDVTLDQLGIASNVKVDKFGTTISGGTGTQDAIDNRVEQIRSELVDIKANNEPAYIVNAYVDRLAHMTSGVAYINVGGKTEAECGEKFDITEDSLGSVRSACSAGVVFGGGLALINAIKNIDLSSDDMDINMGINVVKQACMTPFNQININAGKTPEVIINKIEAFDDDKIGYDTRNDTFVDMVKSGIIDSTQVVSNALKNGASVATLLLNTNTLITDDPNNKPVQPQQPMM